MSKIMVVEDDASLREIYSIRLTAEGYNVVSANDGEEALATAVRERPVLILSDVMMPRISGFDMLDILRSTPETMDIRVIMMTALSSDDQRRRGEALGCDRYLVKSQVGIEDVVNVIHEVLGDKKNATSVDATIKNSAIQFGGYGTFKQHDDISAATSQNQQGQVNTPAKSVSVTEIGTPNQNLNPQISYDTSNQKVTGSVMTSSEKSTTNSASVASFPEMSGIQRPAINADDLISQVNESFKQ